MTRLKELQVQYFSKKKKKKKKTNKQTIMTDIYSIHGSSDHELKLPVEENQCSGARRV
jgi:hypothetical protein